MPQTDTTTSFLSDSQQGRDAFEGWRVAELKNLQITAEGLQLAPAAIPPVPLKDAQGVFGGLENPTGVAVAADGTIYIADGNQHRIFKVERREGLRPHAIFYRIGQGQFARDCFVYVPVANRLERWPRALRKAPQSFDEVDVISETVWNAEQARRLILSCAKIPTPKNPAKNCVTPKTKKCCDHEIITLDEAALIEKEWEADYPANFPSGKTCQTAITYLPCLGGLGNHARQFNEPRGLAVSTAGDLYVADSRNHRIQVFALRGLVLKKIWGKRAGSKDLMIPPHRKGECQPEEAPAIHFGQPMPGEELGEFNEPWDVVADNAGNVYMADKGNQRVQKYDCRVKKFSAFDGTILSAHFFRVRYGGAEGERFVFIPARRRLERWTRENENIVVQNADSVSAARKLVLDLIGAKGAKDILREWEAAYPKNLGADPPFESPSHLAIDALGRLFVVDQAKDYVKFLDSAGRVLGQVINVDDVGDVLRPTAVMIDADNKLLLANRAGIHRYRRQNEDYIHDGCCATPRPANGNALDGSYHSARDKSAAGLYAAMAVDAKGRLFVVGREPAGVAEVSTSRGFETSGTYISKFFDSDIDRCQWHQLLLEFAGDIPNATSLTVWTYASQSKLSDDEIRNLPKEEWLTGQTNANDFLVLSPPGQYLWLKIEFKGNGTATPVLQRLHAHFPRVSYLQYLPAVYQADPVSKDFLERFLSLFENIFVDIENKIDNFSQYLDPDGVPENFLAWLGDWVDMSFDPRSSIATKRKLLRNAPELYCRRGTPAGLKKLLRLVFDVEAQILEHFQLRRWLFLASRSTLGSSSQLWGNCIIGRLQLNENSRIGDFALVGTGDPQRDPFHLYAHKFSVFVPAALFKSESVERIMRDLIASETPAHTEYVLCKVEARFRVGVQSTIGLDTLVGAYRRLALNQCATLGYDSLLGGAPEKKGPATIKVGERSRVGVTTRVG
ncbi:MAG: phage tail protein [bacterium]